MLTAGVIKPLHSATLADPAVAPAAGAARAARALPPLDPLALDHAQQHPGTASRSQFAFLRFTTGMRAVLVLVGVLALFPYRVALDAVSNSLLVGYMSLAAIALVCTLRARAIATWPFWYWADAAVLLFLCHSSLAQQPGLAAVLLLPIIAVALQFNLWHATALALVSTAALVYPALGSITAWSWGTWASTPLLTWVRLAIAAGLLVAGPLAARLAGPAHALRRRMQWMEALHAISAPRRGLALNVDAMLGLLAKDYGFNVAHLSLAGPEPRVFRWTRGEGTVVLSHPQASDLGERLARVTRGVTITTQAAGEASVRRVDLRSGASTREQDVALWRWLAPQGQGHGVALPVQSYGQASGHLWLSGATQPFTTHDVTWLSDVMAETSPLLERADLLEQLQRESAQRERERIGRDLHDSAVQPYVGLKYGLEALARKAGDNNVLAGGLRQLLKLATEELQNLRDVVGGLRRGDDPDANSSPVAAIERQAQRFETLYGLRVSIFAPLAGRLRGSLGKAVLHMVNEALTNVRRHTSAQGVTMLIDVGDQAVTLKLRNDHGPGELLPDGFVPQSIRTRAAEFGGTVNVTHESDFTEVEICLPTYGGTA
jgi:signal transduction histidine kinase